MTQTLTDNTARQRFEMNVENETVFADYRHDDGILSILYVEAPPALRGKGAAGQLMQGIMDKAKADGVKVRPICGYAASWIERHKEFHDMRV
jgi:predicted GNAT family acetyltransferase